MENVPNTENATHLITLFGAIGLSLAVAIHPKVSTHAYVELLLTIPIIIEGILCYIFQCIQDEDEEKKEKILSPTLGVVLFLMLGLEIYGIQIPNNYLANRILAIYSCVVLFGHLFNFLFFSCCIIPVINSRTSTRSTPTSPGRSSTSGLRAV